MATLKLGTTTAITESGGTVSLDSAVANIPAAGVTGTLPNAVQDNITRLGAQANVSSFHINGSGGWNSFQNEKVTVFTNLETGGHGHNVGNDYITASSHYVVPVNGVYCLYLQAYTFNSDATNIFYWAESDVVIPNQSDGMYMQSTSGGTSDTVCNYSQCITLNADDIITLRAASNASDLYGPNSFIGGFLIFAT